ncbi:DgyrCDS14761 [Dimorphilus gyrociliatus]|uniref:DgyrCDS14761 n=1 Tax=Dimorphilus gyrociliatus TaxID=2664684 RepID=A0A7I8WF53_9ANNE|nr:DgyrCDS14761 [Dimorphilus gyrociliatus]
MAETGYICTLEEKYIKKAKDELNEIPSDRLSAVQALRDWINEQKHIKFDTKTLNLIRFLRHAKYSQAKARETIENVIKFVLNNQLYFLNLDSQCDLIQDTVRRGQLVLLPGYDNEGRIIVLYKLNMISFEELKKKYKFMTFIKTLNAIILTLKDDEMFQVNGFQMIFDMTGFNLKMLSLFHDPEAVRFNKESQKAQVGRMKGIHYYNIGILFEALFSIYKPFMSKKQKERLYVHETLESLFNHIPKRMLPDEYLPDEYDGQRAGSLLDLGAETGERLLKYNDQILEFTNPDNFGFDESKKSSDEPLQHFRKLNID